jgi:hypothetical protein
MGQPISCPELRPGKRFELARSSAYPPLSRGSRRMTRCPVFLATGIGPGTRQKTSAGAIRRSFSKNFHNLAIRQVDWVGPRTRAGSGSFWSGGCGRLDFSWHFPSSRCCGLLNGIPDAFRSNSWIYHRSAYRSPRNPSRAWQEMLFGSASRRDPCAMRASGPSTLI